jgi:hypothetical protein
MTEQANSARRSILIVHGGDFKPPQEVYMDEASTALRAGVQRDYPDHVEAFGKVGIELAYYGDLGNAYLRSKGRHYDEQLDIGDRRNALENLRKIPQRKRFGLQQYDKLRGKSAVPEAIADVASPLLGMLGLTTVLVRRTFCSTCAATRILRSRFVHAFATSCVICCAAVTR